MGQRLSEVFSSTGFVVVFRLYGGKIPEDAGASLDPQDLSATTVDRGYKAAEASAQSAMDRGQDVDASIGANNPPWRAVYPGRRWQILDRLVF